jgi:DNA polymerase elongation subunit (family B)
VFVTYNGDFFDWPYVEERCKRTCGINLYSELGIRANGGDGGRAGRQTGRQALMQADI